MTLQVEVIELPETATAVLRGHATGEGIAAFLGRAFSEVMAVLNRHGARAAGPPFARYQPTGDQGFDIEAGFPVDRTPVVDGQVEAGVLPGGPAARVLHVGAYSEIGPVYGATTRWLADHGYTPSGTAWESYLDGPEVAAPRTLLCIPCSAGQHE